jgi:hypothetical protein
MDRLAKAGTLETAVRLPIEHHTRAQCAELGEEAEEGVSLKKI